ncbi:MAG: DNA topology modulation protein [Eubacterium sp.]|nr:DNA topology modulation protein [Eubacterium sp.]
MKIAIIGYSGAGKSTLARRLGKYYNVDILHFDRVHFLPNWKIRSDEEKKQITKEFLDTHSQWVIEGNYSKLFYERRMEEADLIIMMLFHRFACLKRVIKRYQKYKNKTRPDMGEGCNEKLDAEFIWWVLHEGRTKHKRDGYKKILAQYCDKTIIIKNQRQLNNLLKNY